MIEKYRKYNEEDGFVCNGRVPNSISRPSSGTESISVIEISSKYTVPRFGAFLCANSRQR